MAINKRVPDRSHPGHFIDVPTIPAFSYPPTDGLAQVILDAWADPTITATLMLRDANGYATPAAYQMATQMINAAGFGLKRAVLRGLCKSKGGKKTQDRTSDACHY